MREGLRSFLLLQSSLSSGLEGESISPSPSPGFFAGSESRDAISTDGPYWTSSTLDEGA